MPIVNVKWLSGRTVEQKRLVAQRFTSALEEVGVQPESLFIVFDDVEREDWARGATLMSDQ